MATMLGWACVVALGACAETPPVPPASSAAAASPAPATGIAGTRWVGVAEEGADHRTLPRLEFVREGRLAGYTGCNMLSGLWTMEGDVVRVGRLVTTKRLCVGPEGEVEKRVLAALAEGGRGRREGSRLVFTGPKGERFEFEQAAAT
ncbi:MAG TPA: META domain-containing protein [Usitatibacter sp.]|jgi:heat shock protein HslJ